MSHTKIVCTLGPASLDATVLRKMMRAGMDIVRLNFSHGKLSDHLAAVGMVRRLNRVYRRRLGILGDLEGHRVRIGDLPGGKPVELKKRQTVWLVRRADRSGDGIVLDYEGPFDVIRPGHHIYIDDGNIALEVTGRTGRRIKARVVIAGVLKEHKGVNIPDAKLVFRGISHQDIRDIAWSVKHGVDYIAQSFVRSSHDIHVVRDIVRLHGGRTPVIAKIENRDGIRNIDAIIDAADGIMVARGDMGVSLPIYEVPIIQKMIIRKCNAKRKLVITATQMLESMVDNHIPKRAEVSDVANAIIDGTDCVMLSAESAVGHYPVETVAMMQSIIAFTEGYLKGRIGDF